MSDSFATPWTVALQASLSIEVSRQDYWSGLPFPLQEIHTHTVEYTKEFICKIETDSWIQETKLWFPMEREWTEDGLRVWN